MDYKKPLKYHYKAKGGWMNDPNGLVYFNGYYHVFYQHAPHHSVPWQEPMHWGHARTKDFIEWEELPVALTPSEPYDRSGCWSGTAIVKDGRLYLFYTGITAVSVIAVAVAMIAAAIIVSLLTACATIKPIRNFFFEVFDEYFSFTAAPEENYNEYKIENYYILSRT